MGKRGFLRRVIGAFFALMMVVIFCIIAVPSYEVQAATKKVTAKLTADGGEEEVDMVKNQKVQIRLKKKGKLVSTTSVTYKSTKKSVATVSKKGVITAKKNGEAEIEIYDKKSDYTAIIYVYVNKTNSAGKGKKSEAIWLDLPSINLSVGQTHQCKLYSRPSGSATVSTVFWQSENSEIATVYGGLIKALKPGDVRIYAIRDNKSTCIMVHINGNTGNYNSSNYSSYNSSNYSNYNNYSSYNNSNYNNSSSYNNSNYNNSSSYNNSNYNNSNYNNSSSYNNSNYNNSSSYNNSSNNNNSSSYNSSNNSNNSNNSNYNNSNYNNSSSSNNSSYSENSTVNSSNNNSSNSSSSSSNRNRTSYDSYSSGRR